VVRTPGDFFFVVVNGHVWEMVILRTLPADTSEAARESGQTIGLGVSIRVRSAAKFFFLSRDPQVFDRSSTGFPHYALSLSDRT
jgi:hypothetical protein